MVFKSSKKNNMRNLKKRVSKTKVRKTFRMVTGGTVCDVRQPNKYNCPPGTFCCRGILEQELEPYTCCPNDTHMCSAGRCAEIIPEKVQLNKEWREYLKRFKTVRGRPYQARYYNITKIVDPSYNRGFSVSKEELPKDLIVELSERYINHKENSVNIGDILYCGTHSEDNQEGFYIVMPINMLVKFPHWLSIDDQVRLIELKKDPQNLDKLLLMQIDSFEEISRFKDILRKYNVKYDDLFDNFPESDKDLTWEFLFNLQSSRADLINQGILFNQYNDVLDDQPRDDIDTSEFNCSQYNGNQEECIKHKKDCLWKFTTKQCLPNSF
jgi:hypothetical protein